jgi:hypothetical protein
VLTQNGIWFALLPDKWIAAVHSAQRPAGEILSLQQGDQQFLCSGFISQREPDAAQVSLRELKFLLQIQCTPIQRWVNSPQSVAACTAAHPHEARIRATQQAKKNSNTLQSIMQIDCHIGRGTSDPGIAITRDFLKILQKKNVIIAVSIPRYSESFSDVPVIVTLRYIINVIQRIHLRSFHK